ncbi:MAG: LysR family transcriptional regulator [Oscillospiraceae bacterium]
MGNGEITLRNGENMTIRNMEIFVTVADTGSMSAAAEKLYITQPSVSLAISDIEKEYSVKLFDRTGRRLRLTPAGRRLLGYSNGIIHLNEELERFLRNESHNPGIRIGATATVGVCVIAPIIELLRAETPEVKCEVSVANTKIIEEKLLKSELDIGLVEGDVKTPDLVVKPVINDELAVICSPKHPFSGRSSVKIAELVKEELILREVGSGTRAKLETAMSEHGLICSPSWSSYSFEAIKEAVLHNLGITVMSARLVRRELLRGELCVCPIEDTNLSRTFDLVYRKNKFFSSTLTRFADICSGMEKEKLGG